MGVVIRSWTALVEEIEKRRSNGERVVTTNGIFDILHVGHARYLKEARALGDLLVIGVNSETLDVTVSINKFDDIRDRKKIAEYLKPPRPLTLGQLLSPMKGD